MVAIDGEVYGKPYRGEWCVQHAKFYGDAINALIYRGSVES